MLTEEQIVDIEERLALLPEGFLSRVKPVFAREWQLGIIRDHTAMPLTDQEHDNAWNFVEHAREDIRNLLDALEAERSRQRK